MDQQRRTGSTSPVRGRSGKPADSVRSDAWWIRERFVGSDEAPDRETESQSIEDVLNGKDRARIDDAHRAAVDDDNDEPLEGDPD
jgi:hypothetical protein